MHRVSRWVVVALVGVAAMQLSACAQVSDEPTDNGQDPATVQSIKGTDLSVVRLTRQAANRLGIRTAVVQRAGGARELIPYSAVLYDADGKTFAYTSPRPLAFVRAPISVADIKGNRAVLSAGPRVGTAVVTVGGPELYGTEFGVEE